MNVIAHRSDSPPANRITVAIVDDQPDDRAYSSEIVRRQGWNAAGYSTAEEFLHRGLQEVHCVLSDLRLPGIDGSQLQERLLAIRPELPIIFLSAGARVEETVEVLQRGAVTLLTKPSTPELMRTWISRAIARREEFLRRQERKRSIQQRFAALPSECFEVLELLLVGLPNKAVAARLDVGLRTVERRRATALRILDVDSVVAAALLHAEMNLADSAPLRNDAVPQPQGHFPR